jgi:predicted transcriptional regulator
MDIGKVRLSLQVPEELNRILETMAGEMGGTKSEVLRRALTLMEVAHQARKSGKKFGIASKDTVLETEIIGI